MLVLAACNAPSAPPESSFSAATGFPSAHIHCIAVDEATGKIMVATYEGLFNFTAQPAVKISPTIDLMGFSPTEDPDVFYASDHPDPSDPVGLIRTGDGGKTWEELSRQSEADFHAMTMSKSGVVAFDGILRISPDGKHGTRPPRFQPAVLAGNPGLDTVLATTQQGLQRSTDGGKTWQLLGSGPSFSSPHSPPTPTRSALSPPARCTTPQMEASRGPLKAASTGRSRRSPRPKRPMAS